MLLWFMKGFIGMHFFWILGEACTRTAAYELESSFLRGREGACVALLSFVFFFLFQNNNEIFSQSKNLI